jgi:hypothetical protein
MACLRPYNCAEAVGEKKLIAGSWELELGLGVGSHWEHHRALGAGSWELGELGLRDSCVCVQFLTRQFGFLRRRSQQSKKSGCPRLREMILPASHQGPGPTPSPHPPTTQCRPATFLPPPRFCSS